MLVRFPLRAKALSATVTTEVGIVTEVIPLCEKALLAIAVTPYGIVTVPMQLMELVTALFEIAKVPEVPQLIFPSLTFTPRPARIARVENWFGAYPHVLCSALFPSGALTKFSCHCAEPAFPL
jgi:hypothetical protein